MKNILRTLIKEAIQHRISEIDKAGNEAAVSAKLSKIKEDEDKINKLKSLLEKPVFEKYIDSKILKMVLKDLENSLKELDKAKSKLGEKTSKPRKQAPIKASEDEENDDTESLQESTINNLYQGLDVKKAIEKATTDYASAVKKNNESQADKIAGNLKNHLDSLKYNWKTDPYALEILSDFI